MTKIHLSVVWTMHIHRFINSLNVSFIIHQSSEESSLRALESLMTEFFHSCTTNERKREIGMFGLVKPTTTHWEQGFVSSTKLGLTETKKKRACL